MNIKDFKQKKQRGHSVKELGEELYTKSLDYDSVLIVALRHDKGIDVSVSTDNNAEMIGCLEVAKAILVDGIRDNQE